MPIPPSAIEKAPTAIEKAGEKGREIEHAEGLPTRRAEFRAFARKIIEDEVYQENLLLAMRNRKVSPAVERLILEAAFCSVKVDEQGGADEQKRSSEMRDAVAALVASGKGAEIDARLMGARRVLKLPPGSVRRVDDDDSA
jgi:hypothetical protein